MVDLKRKAEDNGQEGPIKRLRSSDVIPMTPLAQQFSPRPSPATSQERTKTGAASEIPDDGSIIAETEYGGDEHIPGTISPSGVGGRSSDDPLENRDDESVIAETEYGDEEPPAVVKQEPFALREVSLPDKSKMLEKSKISLEGQEHDASKRQRLAAEPSGDRVDVDDGFELDNDDNNSFWDEVNALVQQAAVERDSAFETASELSSLEYQPPTPYFEKRMVPYDAEQAERSRNGRRYVRLTETNDEPAVDWKRKEQGLFPESLHFDEPLMLDPETVNFRTPRLYGLSAFKHHMGRAVTDTDSKAALLPMGENSYRYDEQLRNMPVNVLDKKHRVLSMQMMVRYKPGQFLWIQPHLEHERHNLNFWIERCKEANVFLKGRDDCFVTPAAYNKKYNTRYVKDAASVKYATLAGTYARNDLPKVAVQVNKDFLISYEQFSKAFQNKDLNGNLESTAGNLRNYNVLFLSLNGSSFFSPGTARLNNPEHFSKMLGRYAIDSSIADRPQPKPGELPSFLVRRDENTLVSGEMMRGIMAANNEPLNRASVPEKDIFGRNGNSGGKAGNYSVLTAFQNNRFKHLDAEQKSFILPAGRETAEYHDTMNRSNLVPLVPSVQYLTETGDLDALDAYHNLQVSQANIPGNVVASWEPETDPEPQLREDLAAVSGHSSRGAGPTVVCSWLEDVVPPTNTIAGNDWREDDTAIGIYVPDDEVRKPDPVTSRNLKTFEGQLAKTYRSTEGRQRTQDLPTEGHDLQQRTQEQDESAKTSRRQIMNRPPQRRGR
ncbi:hypothetical protein C6558_31965 [Ensifer sp. NM-2]|uniref:hypothetical protein n=1 Tax=Ensifer sp. NM-2 TaxID=2109730 RepID=UPI000D11A3DB|nr:hypothetical protein [Ensifer sp. NM-2]PSS60600.1 hypothetical protein C6558_31965 [Ensifer sp. NM-2]